MEFMTDNKTKSKSKLGVGKSGRKRMNKKEASKWFQTLTRLERSLLKQEKLVVVVVLFIRRGEKNQKRNA
jgi:hypothetical protein